MIRKKILLFPTMLLLAVYIVPTHALGLNKEANFKQSDEKQGKSWPKTVKEAVTRVLSEMSEKDKEAVRNTKKEDFNKFHHGWGTGIRNDMGLWQGNAELLKDAKANHPDDASMVIIEAVWTELQNKK